MRGIYPKGTRIRAVLELLVPVKIDRASIRRQNGLWQRLGLVGQFLKYEFQKATIRLVRAQKACKPRIYLHDANFNRGKTYVTLAQENVKSLLQKSLANSSFDPLAYLLPLSPVQMSAQQVNAFITHILFQNKVADFIAKQFKRGRRENTPQKLLFHTN